MTAPDHSADRDLQRGLARAIARSWRDPEFARVLELDPAAALGELGVTLPSGTRVVVVPEGSLTLPLPTGAVSDEAIDAAALAALDAWAPHLADGVERST